MAEQQPTVAKMIDVGVAVGRNFLERISQEKATLFNSYGSPKDLMLNSAVTSSMHPGAKLGHATPLPVQQQGGLSPVEAEHVREKLLQLVEQRRHPMHLLDVQHIFQETSHK